MAVPIHILKDESRYRLLFELNFGEVLPFVIENIRRRGPASLFYLLVNLGLLLSIPLILFLGLSNQWFPWQSLLWQIPTGLFAGSILIIPVHEALHGLAYRMLGARKIIFGSDLSQFIFFVTAKEYPVSGQQLYFLAMLPFLVINISILAACCIMFPGGIVLFAFLLLSHNLMCIGDFAMVNFACLAGTRIFNYDDPEKRVSYFYEEITTYSSR